MCSLTNFNYSKNIDYINSGERLYFFKDGEIDNIYISHCLEHFSHRSIDLILKEYHRVLKEDGKLIIAVPDFDVIIKAYYDNNMDTMAIVDSLYGSQHYYGNLHKIAYNEKTLTRLLNEAGFVDVKRWQHSDIDLNLPKDSSTYIWPTAGGDYDISLNLMGTKSKTH